MPQLLFKQILQLFHFRKITLIYITHSSKHVNVNFCYIYKIVSFFSLTQKQDKLIGFKTNMLFSSKAHCILDFKAFHSLENTACVFVTKCVQTVHIPRHATRTQHSGTTINNLSKKANNLKNKLISEFVKIKSLQQELLQIQVKNASAI